MLNKKFPEFVFVDENDLTISVFQFIEIMSPSFWTPSAPGDGNR